MFVCTSVSELRFYGCCFNVSKQQFGNSHLFLMKKKGAVSFIKVALTNLEVTECFSVCIQGSR